ncbi:MAG TPA: hypothetical protein VF941_02625 [Clostridia bacterium]
MCSQCEIVIKMINGPKAGDYIGNLYELDALEKQGILELYAGNSPIEDVRMHCEREDRYTISHYFKCKSCGKTFHIGFCCRGGYLFKEADVENIDFDNIFNGTDKLGTYFLKK